MSRNASDVKCDPNNKTVIYTYTLCSLYVIKLGIYLPLCRIPEYRHTVFGKHLLCILDRFLISKLLFLLKYDRLCQFLPLLHKDVWRRMHARLVCYRLKK